MDEPLFPESYRKLFEGEVYGEAMLCSLVAAAKDERHYWMFANILQLETETKARLRPVLVRHGLDLTEQSPKLALVGQATDLYRSMPWSEFAAGAASQIGDSCVEYQQMVDLGPESEQPVLRYMVEHERAIHTFFQMEAAGRQEGSLDAVLTQLQNPVARPG